MISRQIALYSAAGVGAIILALVIALMFTGARLDTARAELKTEQASHSVTRASVQSLKAANEERNRAVQQLMAESDARQADAKARIAAATAAETDARALLAKLRASAAVPRPALPGCTISNTLHSQDGL